MEKTLKKHLCRHDKNYYYFWESNKLVINLISDFINMIKVSKTLKRFHTSFCIWSTIFKEPTIFAEIVGFLKIVGEIQQLVRKRSQKSN